MHFIKYAGGFVSAMAVAIASLGLCTEPLYVQAEEIENLIETEDLMDFYVDNATASVSTLGDTSQYPSLKELYQDAFYIGVAVPEQVLKVNAYSNLIKQQFSSMTMENEMKPGYIMDQATSQSDPDAYKEQVALNFNAYKAGMDYAKENGIHMRGHTLVWHAQTPDWFFYENYDTSGTLASRELMLKRMENYIKDVICWTETNYPGVIYAWDVVNEAVADPWGIEGLESGEPSPMRQENSMWYQTIGEDFVQQAFAYARKYTQQYAPDHKIKLFYNDYNEYFSQKRDGIIELLKPVKEAGNIDGVGMQSHIDVDWNLYGNDGYMTAVRKFSDELGVEIHVTELDIGMTSIEHTEESQGRFYQEFMEALLEQKHSGVDITSVTFWGLTDALSWRPGTNCLLFREDLSCKPAFEGVVMASRPELVSNGSFENGLAGWEAYEDGTVELDTATVCVGEQAAKLSGRSKNFSGMCQDVTGKMETGGVYKVSARVQYHAGEGTDNASAYEKTNFNICVFYGESDAVSNSIQIMASGETGSDTWGIIEGTYTVLRDADMRKVRIFVETGFSAEPAAEDLITYYVDEVSIKKAGDAEIDQSFVDEAIAAIYAIGDVSYTEASKARIDAAEAAYKKLTAAEKQSVTNYATLTAAVQMYENLKAKDEAEKAETDANKEAADAVGQLIGQIGTVENSQTNNQDNTPVSALAEGNIYKTGNYNYKITSLADKMVTVVNTVKKSKTISIGDTVTINGETFKITAIEKNAFKGNSKVTTVKIGRNVTVIGANAFSSCKQLKKVTINSKNLEKIDASAFYNCKKLSSMKITSSKLKTVGKNAFKGTAEKIKVDVPNKKARAYKKMLQKKGLPKTAAVK